MFSVNSLLFLQKNYCIICSVVMTCCTAWHMLKVNINVTLRRTYNLLALD